MSHQSADFFEFFEGCEARILVVKGNWSALGVAMHELGLFSLPGRKETLEGGTHIEGRFGTLAKHFGYRRGSSKYDACSRITVETIQDRRVALAVLR